MPNFGAVFAATTALLAATVVCGMPASAQEATTTIAAPPPAPSLASADYRVGPGDTLYIAIYRSPDLTTQLAVSEAGTIVFPQLGLVPVAELTVGQIGDTIATKLRNRGILLDPVVNVSVLQIQSKRVSVMGAVARPGEVALDRPGKTLSAVLAEAGATVGSGGALVTVVEGTEPGAPRAQMLLGDIVSGTADRPARAGEVLIVQSAPIVYVSGEVGRPGAYAKEPRMTVGQIIALAGGITPRGSSDRIRVGRSRADGTIERFRKIGLDDPIVTGDLIIVKTRIF